MYQVILRSFTCFAIYDKVIECSYNNDTCRCIVIICFVYMSDNTNYLFSFVFNETENEMYIKNCMSFYSENSLLLLYKNKS